MQLTFFILSMLAAIGIVHAQRKCGNALSKSEIKAVETKAAAAKAGISSLSKPKPGRPKRNTIRVHWHVISQGSTLEEGNIPDSRIKDSMRIMNQDYASTGLRFLLVNTTRTVNATWFNGVDYDNSVALEMKAALRVGDASELNIFSVGFTSAGLLGYASYPWDFNPERRDDGVVINVGTVPGGSIARFNEGRTLTHEVGHWLGLHHIFGIGRCDDEGDSVDDTPPQSVASDGCPIGQNSCDGDGPDFVWNFMDYSDDSCMRNFTVGQTERILFQIATYRNIV